MTFYLGASALGTAALTANADGSSTASLTVSAAQLPAGGGTVTGQYSGDSVYNAATGSVTVTVIAAAGIFGASLAPYIATWLATNYGLRWVGYYLSAAAALSTRV